MEYPLLDDIEHAPKWSFDRWLGIEARSNPTMHVVEEVPLPIEYFYEIGKSSCSPVSGSYAEYRNAEPLLLTSPFREEAHEYLEREFERLPVDAEPFAYQCGGDDPDELIGRSLYYAPVAEESPTTVWSWQDADDTPDYPLFHLYPARERAQPD